MLVALAAASLMVGKYPLSMDKLLAGNELQWRVFVTLRLSRTIVGLVGGFALGVAGFVYQTVFHNPLASPDIIGVSSGASAGAAAGILFLSGAAALLTIENPAGEPGKELIVFRDSYGSSLIPLLVKDYAKVTVIDTRYVAPVLLEKLVEFKGQDVLMLYSTLLLNSSFSLK